MAVTVESGVSRVHSPTEGWRKSRRTFVGEELC
jgi:hypothetical protein